MSDVFKGYRMKLEALNEFLDVNFIADTWIMVTESTFHMKSFSAFSCKLIESFMKLGGTVSTECQSGQEGITLKACPALLKR